jgi:hypothetical protein
MTAERSLARGSFEVAVGLPAEEVLRRLKATVASETSIGGVLWDPVGRGYVGSFSGQTFRIRIARRTPRFYATHVFGRVEERPTGSGIIFHFGRRSYATWAIWIIRIVGATLFLAALVAAVKDPVFAFSAIFVALGVGSLLWLYRIRNDDQERLRALIVSAGRPTPA